MHTRSTRMAARCTASRAHLLMLKGHGVQDSLHIRAVCLDRFHGILAGESMCPRQCIHSAFTHHPLHIGQLGRSGDGALNPRLRNCGCTRSAGARTRCNSFATASPTFIRAGRCGDGAPTGRLRTRVHNFCWARSTGAGTRCNCAMARPTFTRRTGRRGGRLSSSGRRPEQNHLMDGNNLAIFIIKFVVARVL